MCTETCRLRILGQRWFHESVELGDDADPCKFFLIIQAHILVKETCCKKTVRDSETRIHGCYLYPGRLIRGVGLNIPADRYLNSLKRCDDFSFSALCAVLRQVPPIRVQP